MPTKIQVIEEYLAMMDAGNIDGCYTLVTDDFHYHYAGDPRPRELGYITGNGDLDKEQYKDLVTKIRAQHRDFRTTITDVVEEGEKVFVKGKTNYTFDVPEIGGAPAHTVSAETVFSSEYIFSGDKITHVKAVAVVDSQSE